MNGPKVLIVDDEEPILEEYGGLFDGQPIEILTASDPRKAIAMITDQSITVLVTDQRMPTMTGTRLPRPRFYERGASRNRRSAAATLPTLA